ncbi:MAG: hypothetical protein BGO01_18585 [Armatimonadetes bacterium 55-13]|nr:hypothetical protein [Armatimonadota bacterium]OJU64138.1 MAG: hypothetical protein BGO01_18585 [Armatimonadetes bacterium 55-13]
MNTKLSLAAGFVGFAFTSAILGFNSLGQAAAVLACICLVGLITHLVAGFKRRDPYDLRELKKLQEREENRNDEAELDDYDPSGKPICLHCGEEYDSRLGACPRCRCQ